VTSPAQIAANRRNASKSTAPRTANGKAKSRLNALRHGLTAESGALPSESCEAFDHLRDRLVAEFRPATVLDEILVDRLADLLWRLRRVGLFERELMAWIGERQAEAFDQPSDQRLLDWRGEQPARSMSDAKAGRSLEEFFDKDFALKLGRYEAHLARQVRGVLFDLRLRMRR
jgi:hypothetical protein